MQTTERFVNPRAHTHTKKEELEWWRYREVAAVVAATLCKQQLQQLQTRNNRYFVFSQRLTLGKNNLVSKTFILNTNLKSII
jgi:hypothetical protein